MGDGAGEGDAATGAVGLKRRAVQLALCALCVAEAASAQERVLLRIGGRAGQTWSTTRASVTLGPVPDAAVPGDTNWVWGTRSISHGTRTVLAVSGDTLTVSDVTDSSRLDLVGAPDSANPRSPSGPLLTVVSRIDTRGRVFEVHYTRVAPGRPEDVSGPFGDERQSSEERASFLLPEMPVRVGEEWGDSSLVRTQGDTAASRVRCWRLEGVEAAGGARIAVITGTIRVTPSVPGGASVAATTRSELDLDGGWFRSERTTSLVRWEREEHPGASKLELLAVWSGPHDR